MWLKRGLNLFDRGDLDGTLRCYEEALALDEEYASAWNGKGNALNSLGDHKEALECYDKAVALDDELAFVWSGKGAAHDSLGDYEEALECYDKALALDDEFASAWNGKGLAHRALGDPRKAHRAYRTYIHLAPTYPGVWFNLGGLYRDPSDDPFDDPARAQSAFIRSIHLASTQGKFEADALQMLQSMGAAPLLVARTYQEHHALDLLLREPKGYAEALKRSERFFEWSALFAQDRSLPEAFRLAVLGLEALALGDPIEAERLFTALVETNPESLFAHYYLARSRFAYHEIGAAEEGLRLARSLIHETMRRAMESGKSPSAEQFYYAGLILSMDLSGSIAADGKPHPESRWKAARVVLETAVKYGWHPARFALVDVLDACGDEEAYHAAIEARRERVTAQELEELRNQFAADVQEPFWEDWFDPDTDTASVSDATRVEKQLGHDIQRDIKGERADTHLKLIRYLVLQEAIPSRTATLLAAY